MENIVLKATAKDPFHRYESVEAMEADIRTSLDPSRADEPKFTIPFDDDMTKAIPVITEDKPFSNLDETIIHENDFKKQPDSVHKEPDFQVKKKRKKGPIILTFVLSIVIILIILLLTLLPSLLTPKDIEVPDVSGMSLDRAVTELINAGFVLGETMEISHDDIEEGDVVRTDPKEGRLAKEGSEINIYKSTGKPTFKLLDYTSRNINDVLAVLKNKDFKDIDIVEVPNDSSEGMILDQNYREGEDVIPEETILEFTVSSGPELINVKDLSEYSLIGVQDYANDNGLDVAVFRRAIS